MEDRRSRAWCAEPLESRLLFTTLYVSPSGSNSNTGLSPTQAVASIQLAVNKAKTLAIAKTNPQDNNTIYVASGVYTYDASLATDSKSLGVPAVVGVIDQQLTIVGGFTTSFTAFAGQSIIDGGYAVRGVDVISSIRHTGVTFNNFLIRNCFAGPSTIQNTLTAYGAGMFINMGADPSANPVSTVINTTFLNNTVRGASSSSTSVNSGAGGEGVGGALAAVFAQNVTLINDVFDSNFAKGGNGVTRGGAALGGAVYGENGSNFYGSGLTFRNNQSLGTDSSGIGSVNGITPDGFGGALATLSGCSITLSNVTATNNLAKGGNAGSATNSLAGSGYGGAFYAEESNLSITDAIISGNQAVAGSAWHGGTPAGGGVFIFQGTNRTGALTLNRVSILNNTEVAGFGSSQVGGALGGGVAVQQSAGTLTGNILNSVIAGNSVTSVNGGAVATNSGGGALWVDGATVTLTHDTLANNLVQSNMAGAAIIVYGGAVNLADDVIANETANSVSSLAPVSTGSITLTAKDLFANVTSVGAFSGSGSNLLTSADAKFVDAANRDYNILSTSPARDAATGSTTTVDRNNTARSGTPDLGAYEAIAAGSTSGSVSGAVFSDTNANGLFDGFDYGLSGQHVWADLNNDGVYEPGEPATGTSANGAYTLSGLAPGAYRIRYYVPVGPYFQTSPTGGEARLVDVNAAAVTNISFGVAGNGNGSTATISGGVFNDTSSDGVQQSGEALIPNQHTWIDLNNDGAYEPGEPTSTTDSNGFFFYTGVTPGTYAIRYYVPPGFRQTTNAGNAFTVTVTAGSATTGLAFGVVPTV